MRSALLLVLLCLGGCDLLAGSSPAPFDDLPEARHLRLSASGVRTFHDAAAWDAFWQQHVRPAEGSPGTTPEVDFERRAVVVVSADARSGCELGRPLVRSVRRERDALTVYVDAREAVVGPCDALLRPVQAVVVEGGLQIRATGTF